MARAYQEAHAIDTLLSDVKTLKATTITLQRVNGLQEEKLTNLTRQNLELAKKNAELETRVSAKYISHFHYPHP